MSKIYFTVDENGTIVFSNKPAGKTEIQFDPDEIMPKEEFMAFLVYLRQKENPILPHKQVRSMFNHYDLHYDRLRRLNTIKKAKSEREAYSAFAKTMEIGCVNRKVRAALGMDIYYREDFYEYLRSIGCSREESAFFTEIVSNREYRNYGRRKNRKTLLDISEDLHHFAQAAKLPSREEIIDVFGYEYELFCRAREKAEIDAIPDVGERMRRRTLGYINSETVREHLNAIGYQFSPMETAWLIYQCHSLTMEERHKAWRELIENTPNCEIPDNGLPYQLRLHEFLREYIDGETRLAEEFFRETDGMIYQIIRVKIHGYHSENYEDIVGMYSSVEAFREQHEEMEPDERTEKFICRKFSLNKSGRYEEVSLTPAMEIRRIEKKNGPRLSDWQNTFSKMRSDFPLPFEKGDIVFDRQNYRLTVLTGIGTVSHENSERASLRDDSLKSAMNFVGYALSLKDEAYGVYPYKSQEETCMDLEINDMPLEDFTASLLPFAEMAKGKITEEECLQRYFDCMKQEHEKNFRIRYTNR